MDSSRTLPPPSPVDIVIGLNRGSPTSIKAHHQHLGASQRDLVQSLPNKIVELEKRNNSLNHEVLYYRQMEQARKEFYYEVRRTSENLEKSIIKLGMVQRQVDRDWLQKGAAKVCRDVQR